MIKLVETFIENYSTNETFEFYVTCESCENVYGKTTKRFSKSGAVPTSQIEKTLWNALYEQEMRMVRQIAVRHAAEQLNYCPVCKRLVCNQCFVICDELDMCKQCASTLNQEGKPVLPEIIGTTA